MPAPSVFADGVIDPLPVEPPPVAHGSYGMLYATDRAPAGEKDKEAFYTSRRGHALRLGEARIELLTDPPLEWDEVKRQSLSAERRTAMPLQVVDREEFGILDRNIEFVSAGAKARTGLYRCG